MSITTYAELKAAIADFLNRDDLDAAIDTFIDLAEADMQRALRHWRMEGRSTAEIDTQYSALPADFLEAIRFYVTSGTTNPLELISQGELVDRKRDNLNAVGKPRFYAITSGEIEVYPVPDGTYETELYYYKRITPLSDSNTSNWLLQYHPDAYLYGSLVHSAGYLKDDARVQLWGTFYTNAIATVISDGEKTKFGGTGLRIKPRIV